MIDYLIQLLLQCRSKLAICSVRLYLKRRSLLPFIMLHVQAKKSTAI